LTAYAEGQRLLVLFLTDCLEGNPELNVNSLGSLPLKQFSQGVWIPAIIRAGFRADIVLDITGHFHVLNPLPIPLLPSVFVTLKTPGVHTVNVPTGYTHAVIDLYGAGSGGFKESTAIHGEAGSGGGWGRKTFDVSSIASFSISVGSAGVAYVGSTSPVPNGNPSTVSILGHEMVAYGGVGGTIVSGLGGTPGIGGSFTGAYVGADGQPGGNGGDNCPFVSGGRGGGPLGGAGAVAGEAPGVAQWPGGGGSGGPLSCSDGADGGAFIEFISLKQ
jgi:hypothetical protein